MRIAGIAILLFAFALFGCIDESIFLSGNSSQLRNSTYLSISSGTALLSDAPAIALGKAAKETFDATGKKLRVASATRSLEEQAGLFYDNCLKNSGVCSPPTCDIVKDPSILSRDGSGKYSLNGTMANQKDREGVIGYLASYGKENNCAHTSKVAVDAWCEGCSNYQCDPSCQETLAQKMIAEGFCRLDSEAWHFEWNADKVSPNCNRNMTSAYISNGKAFDPKTGGCALWDYVRNKCMEYGKPEGNGSGNFTKINGQDGAYCKGARCKWWEVCDESLKSCAPKKGYENRNFDCPANLSLGEDGYCHPDGGGWNNGGNGNNNGGGGNGGNRITFGPNDEIIYPGNQQCLSYKSCQACINAAASPALSGCKWFPDSGTCIDMAGGMDRIESCDGGAAGAGRDTTSGGTANGGGTGGATNGGTSKKAVGGAGKSSIVSTRYVCPAGFVIDRYNLCHEECGKGKYCTGDAQCFNGVCQWCEGGDYLGTDGKCYARTGGGDSCPQGYVEGEDSLCHAQCGYGTYCTGDSVCRNGQCLSCDGGEYLGTDGKCHLENGGEVSCPKGYVPGDDGYCHEECGQETYCTGDALCFNSRCLGCSPGFYLATDGQCHSDNGGGDSPCPQGYVAGKDDACHLECGSGTYCTGESQCYNGKCISCSAGDYLGTDGKCHPENGGGELTCEGGFVLGDDYLCHLECGDGTYCSGDAQCFNGRCAGCDAGFYLGTDGRCHSENGGGPSCPQGSYLGEDGLCHADESDSCFPGFLLGDDGQCHKACGFDFYCTGSSQCVNGECISCNPGYYLGNDGRCHSESSCNPGYILGEDNLCHRACSATTYCTGSSICFNGQCLSCDYGYLGTDGRCHEN